MGSQNILNVVIIAILLTTQCYRVLAINWTCFQNGTAVQVDPAKVSGIWYEVARAPSSEVPACLNVTVPDSEVNNEYIMKLNYVNNVNNGWKHTEENLTFPWDEAQNGNFKLIYSDGDFTIDMNFKYLGAYSNYTLVCGYSGIASGISIIRLLSREKIVDNSLVHEIDTLANYFGVDLSEITWVQQNGRCNSAVHLPSFGCAILLVFYLTHKLF